jgi:hypothetical protein
MAFKMKGSAFKLNEVATKSALKQKPISEKARERYMAEELAKLRSEKTIGDEDKAQDLKDARKAAENRWADEQAKKNITKEAMRTGAEIAGAAPVPMESPMKRTGIYKVDEFGNRVQVSRDEYEKDLESEEPTSYHLTGKDVDLSGPHFAHMTDEEKADWKRRGDKGLAKRYGLTGKGSWRRASMLDETIQDKINRGIELTPGEKQHQATAESSFEKEGWENE